MNFNKHSNLEGSHSILSASSYHWINYSEEKMETIYRNKLATIKGTLIHDLASRLIKLRQTLPKSRITLNMFVNDAIGFKMNSEQILYYSDNAFGTADAICFRKEPQSEGRMVLRIYDLKTGETPAHMEQLMVYAALFCLEYGFKPSEIDMELRIYQHNDILIYNPKAEDIAPIMDKIISFDKLINKINQEGE